MQWIPLFILILLGQCVTVCQLNEYHFIKENKTWAEAQQFCREKYSDLVTVSNMTDMKRIFSESPEDMTEAWIGLEEQSEANRTWHWSLPGVEFNKSETNWRTEEPDNLGFEVQNCGLMSKNLKWADTCCGQLAYFLCYNDSSTSEQFYLIKEKKSWLEAQSYCRENHTDLISGLNQIHDANTNSDIFNDVTDSTDTFIGLFRDSWRWSDGNSSSFRHWNLQFDNDQHVSGQCAAITFNDRGRWKRGNCTEPKPFICYDDKMILITESKTWEEALDYCRTNYSDLVTITNPDEQRWVQERAKKASTPFLWMGLHYACTLDLWFWVNDKVVSYENWDANEPMDQCDMSGAMKTGGQHQWVKKNDSEKFNFICSV